jgi:hypothetical protein
VLKYHIHLLAGWDYGTKYFSLRLGFPPPDRIVTFLAGFCITRPAVCVNCRRPLIFISSCCEPSQLSSRLIPFEIGRFAGGISTRLLCYNLEQGITKGTFSVMVSWVTIPCSLYRRDVKCGRILC